MSDNEQDPYDKYLQDSNNLVDAPEKESARSRKIRIFKNKASQLAMQAQQGFMVGAMVGGSFGFIIGLYQAITYKQFLLLPASTIISSISFGFFLGCGSMVRSDDQIPIEYNQNKNIQNKVILAPYWIHKYNQLTQK